MAGRGRPKKNQVEEGTNGQDPEPFTHKQKVVFTSSVKDKEIATMGRKLALTELQLKQTRQEASDEASKYRQSIKEMETEVQKLSTAIDTGTLTEELVCEVILNREKGTKLVIRPDSGDRVPMKMTDEDWNLIS